jgi:2-methylcitrate dehydratase
VKVYPDPTLDMEGPEFRHAVIATIKTTDGRVFTERIDAAKGSNKNPMNREEVVTKYEILSGKVLNKKQIADLYDAVMTLENISDVRELAHLLKKV